MHLSYHCENAESAIQVLKNENLTQSLRILICIRRREKLNKNDKAWACLKKSYYYLICT